MTVSKQLEQLITDFQNFQPIRVGSLIITIFGDMLAPRGGTVWLGSIINLLEPLGINSRHVRTAVSRLHKDDWISPRQVGRKSYYSLTTGGLRRFQNATPQIYAGPRSDWDGGWTLIIFPDKNSGKINKESAFKELGWLGFGKIAKGVLAHPMPDMNAMERTLDHLGIRESVIILQKASHELTAIRAVGNMVTTCWNLDDLSEKYNEFLERYTPVFKYLKSGDPLTPLESLLMRILMVHEYRKILLRDPRLPDKLMPDGWEGNHAYHLCRDIYQCLLSQSEACLDDFMETEKGPLPPSDKEFFRRFGGLID